MKRLEKDWLFITRVCAQGLTSRMSASFRSAEMYLLFDETVRQAVFASVFTVEKRSSFVRG